MKRDRNLMRLILQRQRDGVVPLELDVYPAELRGYTAALLIEGKYVDGSIVQGWNGQKTGTALGELTGTGHDLLEELEREHSQSGVKAKGGGTYEMISIFVSHSKKDERIAEALIELLRAALNIPAEKIRCTSVVPYKLPVGADTDDKLRAEIHGCEVFIGVVTPNSVASAYVLFELGARWGAGLSLYPVLVGGKSELLRGPLQGLNAADCCERGEVLQLVTEIGAALSLKLGAPHTYDREVSALVELANEAVLLQATLVTNTEASTPRPQPPTLDETQKTIIKCLACWQRAGDEEMAVVLHLPVVRTKYYLDRLKSDGLAHSGSYAPGIGNEWSLTNEGNAFAVENSLDSGAPHRPKTYFRGRGFR